jgi:hypothetical protein
VSLTPILTIYFAPGIHSNGSTGASRGGTLSVRHIACRYAVVLEVLYNGEQLSGGGPWDRHPAVILGRICVLQRLSLEQSISIVSLAWHTRNSSHHLGDYMIYQVYKRESGSADQNMLSFGNNSSHDPNATKLCQTQFEHLIKDIRLVLNKCFCITSMHDMLGAIGLIQMRVKRTKPHFHQSPGFQS